MHTRILTSISRTLIAVATCVLLSGCLYSREIAHVKRDIEREFPGSEFDREIVLSVGPGFFRTIEWLARHTADEDGRHAADYISELRRVKLGVYETLKLPYEGELDLPSLKRFDREGWIKAATVRDRDELVWVLYRERYDEIRDMFFLILDDDELVIVRVEGNLNRLLEKVMEDERFAADLFH